jgi:hypothetical protein
MRDVGRLTISAIEQRADEQALAGVAAEVREICARFPVPGLPQE